MEKAGTSSSEALFRLLRLSPVAIKGLLVGTNFYPRSILAPRLHPTSQRLFSWCPLSPPGRTSSLSSFLITEKMLGSFSSPMMRVPCLLHGPSLLLCNLAMKNSSSCIDLSDNCPLGLLTPGDYSTCSGRSRKKMDSTLQNPYLYLFLSTESFQFTK